MEPTYGQMREGGQLWAGPKWPSADKTPELPNSEGAFPGATGCLDPRCPGVIEAALVKAGWHHRGVLGWSNDHTSYFSHWEIPVAQLIAASAGPDNDGGQQ